MKIYYIANARMPTEKAHGIQIAKMCEAFIELGVDLELVVPSRKTVPQTLAEFYHLRVPVVLTRLPVPDFYLRGVIGYRISSYIFMAEYTAFLWWKRVIGEKFSTYTVDLDAFSSSALVYVPTLLYSEMHGAKPNTFAQRQLFKKARGIIAINSIIIQELQKTFPSSHAAYVVEPNGVDINDFTSRNKIEARHRLGLPEGKIVLYTGRFFEWKGLEILPQAAALTPSTMWYLVGGTEGDFKEIVKESLPKNIFFVGSRPHAEMSEWQAAADVLVVLGTIRDSQSYYYTSPMKVFEYMLSERPIVASNTPAIREIVTESEVFFYEPDNAQDMAVKVTSAIEDTAEVVSRTRASLETGKHFSWHARAQRIKQFMSL